MLALQLLQIQMLHGAVVDFCTAFAQMSHDGAAECAGTYTSRSREEEKIPLLSLQLQDRRLGKVICPNLSSLEINSFPQIHFIIVHLSLFWTSVTPFFPPCQH